MTNELEIEIEYKLNKTAKLTITIYLKIKSI